jgi:hypothetical protein
MVFKKMYPYAGTKNNEALIRLERQARVSEESPVIPPSQAPRSIGIRNKIAMDFILLRESDI